MCDPITLAMTGAKAITAMSAGSNAQILANARAEQADYAATVEQQNALKTAEIIRRAGRRQVGQAAGAYAAAGVKVGEGSAGEVERQINTDVERDAFQAILEGDRRAIGLRTDAKISRASGQAARAAGYVNAAGSVMAGAAGYAQRNGGGWKTFDPRGWDLNGPNGTNDRGPVSFGSPQDWFQRNGTSGD